MICLTEKRIDNLYTKAYGIKLAQNKYRMTIMVHLQIKVTFCKQSKAKELKGKRGGGNRTVNHFVTFKTIHALTFNKGFQVIV